MKRLILSLLLLSLFSFAIDANDGINSNDVRAIRIGTYGGSRPHIYEPAVMYRYSSSTITVDFGTQPVTGFTVTISSPLTDVDYYATSSFVTIPLAVDGYSDYTIIIETVDGDVFEGTLTANEYSTNATF